MRTYRILLDGETTGYIRATDRESALRKVRKANPQWFPERSIVLIELPD